MPVNNGNKIKPVCTDGNIGDVNRPDLIGACNLQSAQQVRINRVFRRTFAGILARINGLNPHFPHMPIDGFVIDEQIFLFVKPYTHPAIAELRVCSIQFINHPLDFQVFRTGGKRLVVQATPVQPQQFRLRGNRKFRIVRFDESFPLWNTQFTGQLFF